MAIRVAPFPFSASVRERLRKPTYHEEMSSQAVKNCFRRNDCTRKAKVALITGVTGQVRNITHLFLDCVYFFHDQITKRYCPIAMVYQL